MRAFKVDTERKNLWDLSKGVIYHIIVENDYFMVISGKNGCGLFDKEKECITIEPQYDWIAGPYKGIPGSKSSPFVISKDSKLGIAFPNGTIAIEPIIDTSKYIIYPDTYGEGFVAATQYSEHMKFNDPMCFLNAKGEQCTDFNYTSIRSPFKDGVAEVTNGNLIIKLDNKFNVIDSYDGVFYGFNDEKYYL